MSALVLTIGQVRIDATGTPEDAQRMEETLRAGLELLAEKLASSALARRPEGLGLALEQIRIGDLSKEDWLGERGAALVADSLYDTLLAGGRF